MNVKLSVTFCRSDSKELSINVILLFISFACCLQTQKISGHEMTQHFSFFSRSGSLVTELH